jgi:hypothetical protein
VPKISVTSFNTDIRKPLGAVLTSGNSFWVPGDAQYNTRYQFGYGVALQQAVAVTKANIIDDPEWDNLRLDLIKARTHQKGLAWVTSNLGLQDDRTGNNNVNDVTSDDKILNSVYVKYQTVASDILTDKFLVANGEFEIETPAELSSSSQTITFSTRATWQFVVTWANAAAANAFFNAGGAYNLGVDASNGIYSGFQRLQSDTFVALLTPGGEPNVVTFAASDWYGQASTTGYVWKTFNVTDVRYNTNKVEIRVLTNTNTIGSSNRLTIQVRLESAYTGGAPVGSGAGAVGYGDSVSLTVEPQVSERRSTNTITAPDPTSYSYGQWSLN